MNVRDLIELLQHENPDAHVYINNHRFREIERRGPDNQPGGWWHVILR